MKNLDSFAIIQLQRYKKFGILLAKVGSEFAIRTDFTAVLNTTNKLSLLHKTILSVQEINSSCEAFLHQVVDALFLLALGIALGLLCGLPVEIRRPWLHICMDEELIFVVRLVNSLSGLAIDNTP